MAETVGERLVHTLVEAGVGLIPAGGGTKELLFRFTDALAPYDEADPFEGVKRAFKVIAMATTSTSALEAKSLGFLRPVADRITMNRDRLIAETRGNPLARRRLAAMLARLPDWQYTITGRSLRFATSAPGEASRASGRFFAPSRWPAANSAGSRTSITSASWRLMSCVASAGLTEGPPKLRRTSGHSSIPPETSATTNRRRLLRTKSTEGG